MRVLVTGSDGYIGAVLAPALTRAGHDVTGLDTGFFRPGWLYNDGEVVIRTLTKDIRRVSAEDLAGIDAVVHLAELSNDPLGHLNPDVTVDINARGSIRLAEQAKAAGIARFVYFSSCSVYGIAEDAEVDEDSPVRPLTPYAECKIAVEQALAGLANADFSPVVLRNATVFGASPRLRFDVVVNNLAGWAWTTRRIQLDSDGSPWRPFVHVLDLAEVVRVVLDAPREKVHGAVLNVGANELNYQIKQVAEAIGGVFPGCDITFGERGTDNRSYRVDFSRLARLFPQLTPSWDVERGAAQLRLLFERLQVDDALFRSPNFTRLARLRELLRTGQIDERFYWAPL